MTQQHFSSELSFVKSTDMSVTYPEPGLIRRIGAYSDKLMLAEHHMQKGWTGVRHSHPHEQLVYVVTGRLKVVVGEINFEVAGGDSFIVRGGVEHEAAALEDCVVVDVFAPLRDDYR
jgi:quercetin dioxygenase-like cupin family protein